MEGWLEEKREELRRREEAIAEFRRLHPNELGADQPKNLQLLGLDQRRLDVVERESQDATRRLTKLEAELKAIELEVDAGSPGDGKGAVHQYRRLLDELADLQVHQTLIYYFFARNIYQSDGGMAMCFSFVL